MDAREVHYTTLGCPIYIIISTFTSVRPYGGGSVQLPISTLISQNITKKGCLVCVRIKYYAFLVDFRPLGCKKQGETKLHILQWRWNVFKDNGDKKIFVLNIVGTIFNNKTFSRLCPKISPSPCPHMFRRPCGIVWPFLRFVKFARFFKTLDKLFHFTIFALAQTMV